jgi:hypothetical protein
MLAATEGELAALSITLQMDRHFPKGYLSRSLSHRSEPFLVIRGICSSKTDIIPFTRFLSFMTLSENTILWI